MTAFAYGAQEAGSSARTAFMSLPLLRESSTGAGAEYPVVSDTEGALSLLDLRLGAGTKGAVLLGADDALEDGDGRVPVTPLQAVVAVPEHGDPGGLAHDAIGLEPARLLELLDGGLGLRAERPVVIEAEATLNQQDARAA